MMETPGFSPWIVVFLIALMLLVLWGGIFFFFAMAAWVIARSGATRERRPPRDLDE